MIPVPVFTENNDENIIMYFDPEGKDLRSFSDELAGIYACYSKMSVKTKDGKQYVAVEVEDGEN